MHRTAFRRDNAECGQGKPEGLPTVLRNMARSSPQGKSEAISPPDAHRADSKSWKDVLNAAKPAHVHGEQTPAGSAAFISSDMLEGPSTNSVPCEALKRSDVGVAGHGKGFVEPPAPHAENDDRGDVDEQEAALEEQARQLDLNVGAAEFSPGFGSSAGQQGMFFPANVINKYDADGMSMRRRNMPFGPAAMRGPIPNNVSYEMMQYYAQMCSGQQFLGAQGSMQAQQLDAEESQNNAAVAHGLGLDRTMNSNPMAAMHRAHHPGNYSLQAAQSSAHGPGGLMQQQFFNSHPGAMNMMPPSMAPYGPNAHNSYAHQGPYMGNMQVITSLCYHSRMTCCAQQTELLG